MGLSLLGLERLRFGLEVVLPVADEEEGRGVRVGTEVNIVNGLKDIKWQSENKI